MPGAERVGVASLRQVYIGIDATWKDGAGRRRRQGKPVRPSFRGEVTTPGRRIDDAFRALREEVSQITEGKQQPEVLQDALREGALVQVKVQ